MRGLGWNEEIFGVGRIIRRCKGSARAFSEMNHSACGVRSLSFPFRGAKGIASLNLSLNIEGPRLTGRRRYASDEVVGACR